MLGTAGAVLVLVLFGQVPGQGRWAAELGDFAHGPAFAVVALLLLALLRRTPGRSPIGPRQYLVVLLLTLLLGGLIELLQSLTGRDASLGDLATDALGALAALGLAVFFDGHVAATASRRVLRHTGLLLAVVSTVVLIAPLGIASAAYLQRHLTFPVLADFDSPLSTYFVNAYHGATLERAALPDQLSRGARGRKGIHVRLAANEHWALALWEPYPEWQGYDRLALDLANPGRSPVPVSIRVRNLTRSGQRQLLFGGEITVAPHSRETYFVPLQYGAAAGQPGHVTHRKVHSVVLTGNATDRAGDLFVSRIWLEQGPHDR